MSTIKIKGATIFTMVKGEAPYEGDIFIKDSRIASIDPSITIEVAEIVDGRGMLAMPGFVNAHQHSPMSLLRAFSDDLKLLDWLERKMLPAENRMTPEDIYWGAKLAIAEMIKSGTTAFADMYIHMTEIAEAVKETGMRASLTRGLIGLEHDGERRMTEAADLIDRWHGQADGKITTMVGPHAPYTCPPHFMKEALALAADKRVPVHTHLAETVEEVAKIRQKYNCTPTEYLADTGLLAHEHVLLAHGVHLTPEDIKLLRGIKGGVAHNPVSNLKLACGIAPMMELLAQGTTIGFGTDGAGSATTLDMFVEMKAAAWLQKLRSGNPAACTAGEVLFMASAGGADLLGLSAEIGTLEPGKKADIILIDLRKPHLQPVHDVQSLLAYSAGGGDVDTTIVNGCILMKNRRLLTMDEEEIFHEAAVRAQRIVAGV